MIAYHVTAKENINNILKNGLIPSIGKRSNKINETQKQIYLFRDLQDANDGVMNWLGDEFKDDQELIVLKIKLPNKSKYLIDDKNTFEIIYKKRILATNILKYQKI